MGRFFQGLQGSSPRWDSPQTSACEWSKGKDGADLEPNQPWAESCDTSFWPLTSISRDFCTTHVGTITQQSCVPRLELCLHAPLPARRPPMQARSKRRRRLHKVSTSCCTYAAASYCSRAIERLSVSITLACMHLPASSSSPSPSPTPPSLHRHPVPSHPQPRLSPHHPTLFLHRPV